MIHVFETPRWRKELVAMGCWLLPLCCLGALSLLAGGSAGPSAAGTPRFGSEEPTVALMPSQDQDPAPESASTRQPREAARQEASVDSKNQAEPNEQPPRPTDALSLKRANPVEEQPRPIEAMSQQELNDKIQQYRATLKKGKCQLEIFPGQGIHDMTQLGDQFLLQDDLEQGVVVDANGNPGRHDAQAKLCMRIDRHELPLRIQTAGVDGLRGRLVSTHVLLKPQLELKLYRALFDHLQSVGRQELGEYDYEIRIHQRSGELTFHCNSYPRRTAQ